MLSETVIMNKINSIFMQMCHKGCQGVKENLLPASDAQDKQLQEMKNSTRGGGRRWAAGCPHELSPRSRAVHLNPTGLSPESGSFPL